MTTASISDADAMRQPHGTSTMKALVFRSPNDIAVERVPIPLASFDEAVIRVTLTTICGTDLHILKGEDAVRPGLVLGHEGLLTHTFPLEDVVKAYKFFEQRSDGGEGRD
jgi:hypothetical protein